MIKLNNKTIIFIFPGILLVTFSLRELVIYLLYGEGAHIEGMWAPLVLGLIFLAIASMLAPGIALINFGRVLYFALTTSSVGILLRIYKAHSGTDRIAFHPLEAVLLLVCVGICFSYMVLSKDQHKYK